MQNFANIPQEMREYRQYVVWRYENRGEAKPTKVPYCAFDGRLASVNEPGSWCSYTEAINAVAGYHGIGFVLTLSDPFCFVDFDATTDPVEMQRQQELRDALDSYSELSPSGQGLHIICKAMLPNGRRKGAIEIYSSGRYMTMTGATFDAKPIEYRQSVASELWASLQGVAANAEFSAHSEPETMSDREVYDQGVAATNGAKFLDLWNGDFHTYHHGDHSAADFALIDMLAFYTQNREQIARLFLLSGLGKRPKALRVKYVSDMITRAFDRLVPQIDLSAIMEQINEVQPDVPNIEKRDRKRPTIEQPPGLMGEISEFIFKTSWKPVQEIAMLGAIGLMAGFAGRAYNANGSGLNLYLLLLARTGRGKEAISRGYDRIFEACSLSMPQINDFRGPGDLASGQGLLRLMSEHRTKSFVSVFGEFGAMLSKISSPTAIGADKMTQRVMLDFFSKSGKGEKVLPTVYSDAERNTQIIESPAFSFIAECAPEFFNETVNPSMVATGLLPRFIISEYDGVRVPSNINGPLMQPSQYMIERVQSLATACLRCISQNVAINIPFTSEALELSRALDKKCDQKINDGDGIIVEELWNRVHLNAIRLAGLVAVGVNATQPVIDKEAWVWAENFVTRNIMLLEDKFESGMVAVMAGHEEESEVEKLNEVIVEFYNLTPHKLGSYGVTEKMHRCGVIPYSYFFKRLMRIKPFTRAKCGPTIALKRALQGACDSGDLAEMPKLQCQRDFDFGGRCFVVRTSRFMQTALMFRENAASE